MITRDEDRLKTLFQQARRRDRLAAPGFERLLARSPRPRRATSRLLLATAAITALALGIWWMAGQAVTRAPFEFGLGDLRVPTDFLLDLTPSSAAGAIPRIGVADWSPLELELPAGGGGPDDDAGRRERS